MEMRINKNIIRKRYDDLNVSLIDKLTQGMSIYNDQSNESRALWKLHFIAKDEFLKQLLNREDDYMDEEYAEKLLKNYKDASERLIAYVPKNVGE